MGQILIQHHPLQGASQWKVPLMKDQQGQGHGGNHRSNGEEGEEAGEWQEERRGKWKEEQKRSGRSRVEQGLVHQEGVMLEVKATRRVSSFVVGLSNFSN